MYIIVIIIKSFQRERERERAAPPQSQLAARPTLKLFGKLDNTTYTHSDPPPLCPERFGGLSVHN